MYGTLRPERYPEIEERLKPTEEATAKARAAI